MLNRALIAILAAFSLAEGLTITVSSDGGNASSPLLYGFMFEVSKSCPIYSKSRKGNY